MPVRLSGLACQEESPECRVKDQESARCSVKGKIGLQKNTGLVAAAAAAAARELSVVSFQFKAKGNDSRFPICAIVFLSNQ